MRAWHTCLFRKKQTILFMIVISFLGVVIVSQVVYGKKMMFFKPTPPMALTYEEVLHIYR